MSRPKKGRARRPAAAGPRRHCLSEKGPLARGLRCERLEDRRLLAVVTVTTVDDTVDFNDGVTSLREAIFATNTVAGADEIRFDPALFTAGARTILLTRGELRVSDLLTITGPGVQRLTIDASGSDATPGNWQGDGSRILNIDDGVPDAYYVVTVSDLRLEGGDPSGDGEGGAIRSREHLALQNVEVVGNSAQRGGGVAIRDATLSLLDSNFSSNSASDGGGVFVAGPKGHLTADGLNLEGNVALARGGGAFLTGMDAAVSPVTFASAEISGNMAGAAGGGAFFDIRTALEFTSLSLCENKAVQTGAGIHVVASALSIVDSTISKNVAGGDSGGPSLGGGVFAVVASGTSIVSSTLAENFADQGGAIQNYLRLELHDCMVRDNDATVAAGGIFAGDVLIRRSTLSGNHALSASFLAGRGGAIYAWHNAVIENSTISGNAASNSGGGIFSRGPLVARTSTFSGNTGASGGGIYGYDVMLFQSTVTTNRAVEGSGGGIVAGDVKLNHTIVAGNFAPAGESPDVFGGLSAWYSLIGSNAGNRGIEAPVGSADARGNLIGGPTFGVISPGLSELGNFGGPTATHLLLAGSPAIDAGDRTVSYSEGGDVWPEQRGPEFPRVIGEGIDIGSTEFISDTLIVDVRTDEFDGDFRRGDLSLREAIRLANLQVGAGEILFSPTLLDAGAATIVLTLGELTVIDSLTVSGPGAELLTLDASGSDPTPDVNNGDGSRVFTIRGDESATDFSISGLTLTGGDSPTDGGAIASITGSNGTLVIDATTMTGNNAARYGGGVFWQGPFEITASRLSGNRAVRGGAALLSSSRAIGDRIAGAEILENMAGLGAGVYWLGRTLSVVDSTISHNATISVPGGGSSLLQSGGGLFLRGQATTIVNSTISGNRAARGGGAYAHSGSLTVQDCTIADNVATVGGGGIRGGATVAISDSIVQNNRAGQGGGGVTGGTVALRRTLIDGNSAGTLDVPRPSESYFSGGGISAGSVVIDSSTISNNFAADRGGGVSISIFGGSLESTITNSTITGNAANLGGGVSHTSSRLLWIEHSTITSNEAVTNRGEPGRGGGLAGSSLRVRNSIIASNSTTGTSPDVEAGAGHIIRFSLIGDGRGATALVEAPVGSPDANGNLVGGPVHGVIDPLLGPLAENGGATRTHGLLTGSPAIDSGSFDVPPGSPASAPEFDQRGAPFSRVVGARIDIGAVEQTGVPFVVDTLLDESDGNYARWDLSLREAIELANAQPGADLILFDPALFASQPGRIVLRHGEMLIDDAVTIAGPGRALLTIDGNDPTPFAANGDGTRLFLIDDGDYDSSVPVNLSGMTLARGDVDGRGGAIWSAEELAVTNVAFAQNTTAMTGDLPSGGAIYSVGSLAAEACTFGQNSAVLGGAIMAWTTNLGPDAVTTIVRCSFSSNKSFAGGAAVHFIADGGDAMRIERSSVTGNNGQNGGPVASYLYGESALEVSQTTFLANSSGAHGGAMLLQARERSRITISGVQVRNNSAMMSGGGIFMTLSDAAAATIADSTLSGNRATTIYGGGAYAIVESSGPQTATLSVSNVSILNNSAPATSGRGGGFMLSSRSGHVTFTDVEVAGNISGGRGGGLYVEANNRTVADVATFSLFGGSIHDNQSGRGGGIYFDVIGGSPSGPPAAPVEVADTAIYRNTATGNGGGVAIEGSFFDAVAFTNTTVSGNWSGSNGGGLWSATPLTLRHSTVANNRAVDTLAGLGRGGGIYAEFWRVTLDHTILANNLGGGQMTPAAPQDTVGPIDARYSLVEAPDRAITAIGGSVNLVGVDPRLAPLADNGGGTMTHALLAGSPALDAGDPALAPGQGGAPEFDQRRAPFTRLAGERVDIGAFEAQAEDGALGADFTFDGRVNGNDFLTWQRNVGRTSGATLRQGDATADGDVDGNDLAVWRARWGVGSSATAAVQVAEVQLPALMPLMPIDLTRQPTASALADAARASAARVARVDIAPFRPVPRTEFASATASATNGATAIDARDAASSGAHDWAQAFDEALSSELVGELD